MRLDSRRTPWHSRIRGGAPRDCRGCLAASQRPGKGERGFTLVELLVAMVLVSMISVLLGGSLRLGTRTWDRVTARHDRAEHDFLIGQFLRRHLSNARFFSVDTSDGISANSFLGNAEQMHFIAPFPDFENDGRFYWWSLSVRENPDSGRDELMLSYVPYDENQQVTVWPDGGITVEQAYDDNGRTTVEELTPQYLSVAPEVVAIAFEYFYRDEEDEGLWIEDWDPQDEELQTALPNAIRVSLAMSAEDSETYVLPQFTIVPRFVQQALFSPVE